MDEQKQDSAPGSPARNGAVLRIALGGLAVAAVFAAGCGSERAVVRRAVVERQVELPPATTDIVISDLREAAVADPTQERVVGTIVNRGDKAVSKLTIRVDALDDLGRIVESITTPPLDQTIAPFGGTATFEASVPRNPAITTYHAVAIAR